MSECEKQLVQCHVINDRFAPLGKITNEVNSQLGTTFHVNTIRKYLHEIGLASCAARKKPLLTEKHCLARLAWCQAKHNWNEEWKQIVWSDESRFALFKSDGRIKVWRKVGEAYKADCVKPTVKYGGGSVMFWGCFTWDGVGPLIPVEETMDSEVYVNILSNHLVPWVNDHPNIVFQQDGASCHTSHYSTWWMESHGFSILDWVAQSPDLNPIENLWDYLDCQIRKRNPLPHSKNELIRAVQEEWANISLETLHHLILSLPRRVEAIIKARGRHVKY